MFLDLLDPEEKNAMIDLASRPADPSARQVVLGRAQELATRFSSAGSSARPTAAGSSSASSSLRFSSFSCGKSPSSRPVTTWSVGGERFS